MTSIDKMASPVRHSDAAEPSLLEKLCLIRDVESFLYLEASLLDERKFQDWLSLLAEDLVYWMPMRKNMAFRDMDKDITGADDIGWFDDDKPTLTKRVAQIMTGVHWSEEPSSRTTRLVSNVQVVDPAGEKLEGAEFKVKSTFLLHRHRLETESDFFAGRREDVLRWRGGRFQIASRKIIIDQTVLSAKNLSVFF